MKYYILPLCYRKDLTAPLEQFLLKKTMKLSVKEINQNYGVSRRILKKYENLNSSMPPKNKYS